MSVRVVARRPAARCALCHDDLVGDGLRCDGCATVTHAGCAGVCPTLLLCGALRLYQR